MSQISIFSTQKFIKLGLGQMLTQVSRGKIISVEADYSIDLNYPFPPQASGLSTFDLVQGEYEEYGEVDGRPAYKKTISIFSLGWSATQYIHFDKDEGAWFIIVPSASELIIPPNNSSITIGRQTLLPGTFLPGAGVAIKSTSLENALSPELATGWEVVSNQIPTNSYFEIKVKAIGSSDPILPPYPEEHLTDYWRNYFPTTYALSYWKNKLEWLPMKEEVSSVLITNSPKYDLDTYADIGGEYVNMGLNTILNNGSEWWLNNNGCLITYTNVPEGNIWEIWTHKSGPWSPPNVNTTYGKMLYYAFAGEYSIPGPGGTIIVESTQYKPWELQWIPISELDEIGVNPPPTIIPKVKRFVS